MWQIAIFNILLAQYIYKKKYNACFINTPNEIQSYIMRQKKP